MSTLPQINRPTSSTCNVIIRLEDTLPSNIGFTLRGNLAVFMSWAITQPKYIVGGWPWQTLGAIRAVATV